LKLCEKSEQGTCVYSLVKKIGRSDSLVVDLGIISTGKMDFTLLMSIEVCEIGAVQMNNVSNWIMGGVMLVLAICGLFVASVAGNGFGYWGGLLFFVFAIWFIFRLIQVSFDHGKAE